MVKIVEVCGGKIVQGSERELEKIRRELTLSNPQYEAAATFSTIGPSPEIPQNIEFFRDWGKELFVPRCWGPESTDPDLAVIDGAKTHWGSLKIPLNKMQADIVPRIVKRLTEREWGDVIAVAPTGSGKTALALAVAHALGRRTIVFVHKEELVQQWVAEARNLLGIEPGICRQEQWEIHHPEMVIATVQTWTRRNIDYKNAAFQFGLTIADEVQRCPTALFADCLWPIPSRWKLGLSATPNRTDSLNRAIPWFFDARVVAQDAGNSIPLSSYKIVWTKHNGRHFPQGPARLPHYTRETGRNQDRLETIVDAVLDDYARGRTCIVAAKHIDNELIPLQCAFAARGVSPALLIGATPRRERVRILERLRGGRGRLLLTTVSLIEEGVDIPRADRMFIVSPIGGEKAYIQLAGRIRRQHRAKRDCGIVLFADKNVPYARKCAQIGKRVAGRQGAEICEEFSERSFPVCGRSDI